MQHKHRLYWSSLVSGVLALGVSSSLAYAQDSKLEGLALLDKLKSAEGLHSYSVVAPSAELTKQRLGLAATLGKAAGIEFKAADADYSDGRSSQIGAADPSASFEYDAKLGRLLFNGGLRAYRGDERTPNLPDEAKAADLARSHLSKLRLAPASTQVGVVKTGGVNLGVTDGKGATQIYEKFKTVRFSRALEGVPVEGDARVVVQLGSEGALAALVYQWPSLQAGEAYTGRQLVDLKLVREQAIKQLSEVTASAEAAFLTGADLVFYDDGRGVVEPAYHFTVERYLGLDKGEPTQIPYDFYLPALTSSHAFYPHLDKPKIAPADGRDESPVGGRYKVD